MMLFLRLKDVRFAPSQAEATLASLGLVAGEVSEESLAVGFGINFPQRPSSAARFSGRGLLMAFGIAS